MRKWRHNHQWLSLSTRSPLLERHVTQTTTRHGPKPRPDPNRTWQSRSLTTLRVRSPFRTPPLQFLSLRRSAKNTVRTKRREVPGPFRSDSRHSQTTARMKLGKWTEDTVLKSLLVGKTVLESGGRGPRRVEWSKCLGQWRRWNGVVASVARWNRSLGLSLARSQRCIRYSWDET